METKNLLKSVIVPVSMAFTISLYSETDDALSLQADRYGKLWINFVNESLPDGWQDNHFSDVDIGVRKDINHWKLIIDYFYTLDWVKVSVSDYAVIKFESSHSEDRFPKSEFLNDEDFYKLLKSGAYSSNNYIKLPQKLAWNSEADLVEEYEKLTNKKVHEIRYSFRGF